MRYVVSINSQAGIYAVTFCHFSLTAICFILTIIFLIKAPRRIDQIGPVWRFLGRINIFIYILDNTFLLPPLNRNAMFIFYGKMPFFPTSGYKFIIWRIISLLILLIHTILVLISPLFYSTMMTSTAPWAGSLSSLHSYRIAYRYILSIYRALDLELKYSAIVGIISIIPLSIYLYKCAGINLFYSKLVYFIETWMVWAFFILLVDIQLVKLSSKPC